MLFRSELATLNLVDESAGAIDIVAHRSDRNDDGVRHGRRHQLSGGEGVSLEDAFRIRNGDVHRDRP